MNVIGAYQAKARFSELLARVEAGETVTITKHNRPVAILCPARADASPVEDLLSELLSFRSQVDLVGDTIQSLIHSGHRR